MDPEIPNSSAKQNSLPDISAPPLPTTKTRPPDLPVVIPFSTQNSTPLKSPADNAASPAISVSPQTTARTLSSGSSNNEQQQAPKLQAKRSSSNLNASRSSTPATIPYRRASSNLNPSATNLIMKPVQTSSSPPRKQPLTPAKVAQDYFQKELDLHSASQSKVVVILHDSCYGHRFSRPRTSKAAMSTIVERPERILATVLGAATAYVMLGGRHAESNYGPHPDRQPPVAESLPFTIRKTSRSIALTHPSVAHVHGSKWMEELQIMCESAENKLAMNGKELSRPIGYGKDENGSPLPKLHEGDLYLCAESLSALQGCLGGVCDAVDTVFSSSITKRAFVCIRPPGHHCSSNFPSGFCWLNNVHVGIAYAAMNHGLTHAAIIDFDLHHGDGSQTITWDHNKKTQNVAKNAAAHKKTPIGYYSLHDINSYPCEWGDEDKVRNASLCIENAHGQSIWNVHLEPWKSLDDFWKLYETRYSTLLEKTMKFLKFHSARLNACGVAPKAAIFISAGFDASEWEGAGMQRHQVNVPTDFYARFTSDVVRLAQQEDLGVDGRIISVLEGGYSDRALTSGVLSHLCGLTDEPLLNRSAHVQNGLANSMTGTSPGSHKVNDVSYDANWWSLHSLESLELGFTAPLPTASKDKLPASYSSPTHASTAKMTEQARERQSLSAQLEARLLLENAPEPPPPEVNWIVASRELSKLIIPTDRQTLSCRHDELNAEASKARKDRQSAVGLPSTQSAEPMQLRDRKAKVVPGPLAAVKTSSRDANRRTTIATVGELPDPNFSHAGNSYGPNARPRRRSSAASSVTSNFEHMSLAGNGNRTSLPSTNTQESNVSSKSGKDVAAGPKKSRAPAGKATSKPRASPRKAPAAVMPSMNTEDLGVIAQNSSTGRLSTAPRSRRTSGVSGTVADEMDSLTSGMKKISIKLKVPSEEEHVAKQKKTEQEEQQGQPKKVRAPRKPAVPKFNKSSTVTTSDVSIISKPAGHVQSPLDTQPAHSGFVVADTQLVEPSTAHQTSITGARTTGVVIPATSEPYSPQLSQLPPNAVSSENVLATSQENAATVTAQLADVSMVDATPSSPVSPLVSKSGNNIDNGQDKSSIANSGWDSEVQQPVSLATDPLQQPRTPTGRRKEDLPVFTASSPIPFAKSRMPLEAMGGRPVKSEPNTVQKNENKTSVWDIPETPRQ